MTKTPHEAKYKTFADADIITNNSKLKFTLKHMNQLNLYRLRDYLSFYSPVIPDDYLENFEIRDSIFPSIEVTTNGLITNSMLIDNYKHEILWMREMIGEFRTLESINDISNLISMISLWKNTNRNRLLKMVNEQLMKMGGQRRRVNIRSIHC